MIGGNVGDKMSIRKVTLSSLIAGGTTHVVHISGFYNYLLIDKPKAKISFIDTLIIPATWYDLHGRRTASGVRFDRTKLTAAHKSLPLGTKAVIEYKGKKVQIEINDRCPKRGIIDLSPAVRDSLRFRSGKVKVLILGK